MLRPPATPHACTGKPGDCGARFIRNVQELVHSISVAEKLSELNTWLLLLGFLTIRRCRRSSVSSLRLVTHGGRECSNTVRVVLSWFVLVIAAENGQGDRKRAVGLEVLSVGGVCANASDFAHGSAESAPQFEHSVIDHQYNCRQRSRDDTMTADVPQNQASAHGCRL